MRRVPIPLQLVRLLREHVDQYGTGPACGTRDIRRLLAAYGRTAIQRSG